MKDYFEFPGEDFQVVVSFRRPLDSQMSLFGVVDAYAIAFPIAELTKDKLKTALYQQAAEKINECYRFTVGVLHQPVLEKHTFYIDIKFKEYAALVNNFSVRATWHQLQDGKHEIILQMQDYMANGMIDQYWIRQARTKKKK